MDLEEAKATVKALSDQFLPKDRLSRGDRLRPAYGHEKMPAGRRPGLGFGVVRGPAVGNVSSARVLVQIQRSSKAPIAKKFRQLVENWLRESGKLPFDPNDFVFQSVRPLLAFVEPDKQKRSILRAPRFPIGPGAMISVGDDYQGAVGCFARNTAGDLIALSAAHVLRREGRQNPPVLSVWQPLEVAPNRIDFGTVFEPNRSDWAGDHDIAEILVHAAVDLILASCRG